MMAFVTPNRRPRISITGVMQFVVQLAHEMMAVPPCGVLRPWTIVSTSSLFEDVAPRVTNSSLNFSQQFAAAVLEHLPQVVIPASGRRCDRSCPRCHDACRSFSDGDLSV